MVRYNEQIRGEVRADAYTITVNYPGQQRQFVGFLYSLNWELKESWCLYVGKCTNQVESQTVRGRREERQDRREGKETEKKRKR